MSQIEANSVISSIVPESLRELVKPPEQELRPAVSMYVPVSTASSSDEGQRIVVKNVWNSLRNQLRAHDDAAGEGLVDSLMDGVRRNQREIAEDGTSIRPAKTIAAFARDSKIMVFELPISVCARAIVAERFHILPALLTEQDNRQFFVLSVCQSDVHLMIADRYQYSEIPLVDVPANIDELDAAEPAGDSLQGHTAGGGLVRHGQSASDADGKKMLRKFLRAVAGGIDTMLAGRREPLVLACEDHLRSLYVEAAQYPHIHACGVSGHPRERNRAQLHGDARSILAAELARDSASAVALYSAKQLLSLTASGFDAVTGAAAEHRVETLLIRREDAALATGEVEHQLEDELLDHIVGVCLNSGARVVQIPADRMPCSERVAAILRYNERV